MSLSTQQGMFEVIDSFAIRRRNEFYFIGNMNSGKFEEEWFINIPLNDSVWIPLKIKAIEEVEMASYNNTCLLLIIEADEETVDFSLLMKVYLEYLPVTIDGMSNAIQ